MSTRTETWLLRCVLVGGIFRYARAVVPLARKTEEFYGSAVLRNLGNQGIFSLIWEQQRMIPTGDHCSCLGCRGVRFQGFESSIKNLQGLCEGGQRKLLQLLPCLCSSQRFARSWE